MTQMSFSDAEYAGKRKQTWRERFLAEMEEALYEITSLRQFAQLSLTQGASRKTRRS
ncbi:hypothetical protein D9M68_876800 [compost metagenome]|jgi:IS5 family transposase